VLIIQLVVQIKLAPFIEVKLDVVSVRRRRRCCASFYSKFGSLQVETILTVALVMLTLCGVVRDSTSHAPCSMPGRAPLRRLCAAYNTQVRTICSALACIVACGEHACHDVYHAKCT